MATLGERLKMLRKEKRMTQMELAELLNQSLRAYQYYESVMNLRCTKEGIT